MTQPHLDSAYFKTLHSGSGQDSFGTVTGQHFKEDDDVDIVSRAPGNKKWHGEVTTRVSGDKWNAKVRRVTSISKASLATPVTRSPDATETVDVTVANIDGQSNKVPCDSDVP
jgi:hypothetical protein